MLTKEETINLVKFYPSRAKKNKRPYCVEDRKQKIKQKFFSTKEEALNYADQIAENILLHSKGRAEVKMGTVFNCGNCEPTNKKCCYTKTRRMDIEHGVIREHSFENSMRDINFLLDIKIEGTPVREMSAKNFFDDPTIVFRIIDPETIKGRVLKTVKNYWANYTDFGSFCVSAGFTKQNIFRETRPKSGGKKSTRKAKIDRVQRSTIEGILEHLPTGNTNQLGGYKRCNWRLAAFVAAQTGMRQGEQRALTWNDVNFDVRVIEVNKGIDRYRNVAETKTEKSNRRLRFPPVVVKALQEEYMRQGKPPKEDLIWMDTRGLSLNPSMFIKKITRAAAAAGVPRITWHELRHYFASAQLALKGGTKDGIWKVSNQLGHSDTTITTKTYGHWLDDYSEDPEETAREDQAALRY